MRVRLLVPLLTAAIGGACGSVPPVDDLDGGPVAHPWLTVTVDGDGTGRVDADPSDVVDCRATCRSEAPAGAPVVLTATAERGSSFAGWSGACSGAAPTCTVTMTADREVRATFAAIRPTVRVTTEGNGAGSVTSTPTGLACPGACALTVAHETQVVLTATPSAGSRFLGWSGSECTGIGPCTLVATRDTTVTAVFALDHSVVVTRTGTGTGQVTSIPAGIACGADCEHAFAAGTSVTLTATPAADSVLVGWSGACSGAGACTVTTDAARLVTARFDLRSHALTVTRTGDGQVTSSPGGIACGGDCGERYPHGTSVVLTATPAAGASFAGWSGAGCTGTGTCTVAMTEARAVTATFEVAAAPNLIFVTSTTTTGNLGGLAGADAICQARARAAGLAGTYRAWLSTPTVNAVDRIGAASGWARVDGKPVASSKQDLAQGRLFYPPRLDELGHDLGDAQVFTATTVGGTFQGSDCAGWTSASNQASGDGGSSAGSSYMWTVFYGLSCAQQVRLYCVGVDRTTTVAPPPVTGVRRAFMALWTPGGGLAGADGQCQTQAIAAGLPGTYKALLASTSGSALSRFDTGGPPWVRADGAVVRPTAAGWAGAAFLDTAPNLSADGSMAFGNYLHWNGATSLTTAGTTASTCADWTDRGATALVGTAGTTRTAAYFGGWMANACDFGFATITCLQE